MAPTSIRCRQTTPSGSDWRTKFRPRVAWSTLSRRYRRGFPPTPRYFRSGRGDALLLAPDDGAPSLRPWRRRLTLGAPMQAAVRGAKRVVRMAVTHSSSDTQTVLEHERRVFSSLFAGGSFAK